MSSIESAARLDPPAIAISSRRTMRSDLLCAFRSLSRSPGFAFMAIVSLALGIGATTAMFSLMDQAVLRYLPVRDPQSLVVLHRDYEMNGYDSSDDSESVFSYPTYRDLRDSDPAFASVIARAGAGVAMSTSGSAWQARADVVSGNFFETLGVTPAAGRLLTPADDRPGAAPAIVLSHSMWLTRFGGSAAIVNQIVDVNNLPVTVIGVASESFHGLLPGSTPGFYAPIAMQKIIAPTMDVLEDGAYRWWNVFARLRPGFTLEKAQAATDAAYHSLLISEVARFPHMDGSRDHTAFLRHKIQLRPAAQGISGLARWKAALIATFAMAVLALLIACANIAGLMLARAAARQREISIRIALGATRRAIARILLAESALISITGGALGIVAAWVMKTGLLGVLPRDFAGGWITASIDLRMLICALIVSAFCTALCGFAPALHAARANVAAALKDAAAQISSAGRALFLRKTMVGAQVALSLTLLMAAGLFVRSLENLSHVDLGFHAERLIAFRINAATNRPGLARAIGFYRQLQSRLEAVPGVLGVAASDAGPFSDSNSTSNITVEGYRTPDGKDARSQKAAVTPGFFRALGIPLRAGREFTDRDDAAAPHAIVVNGAFVKSYLGGKNPIGHRVMFGSSNQRAFDLFIVGVAADSRKEVRNAPGPMIYFPYARWTQPAGLMYYIRSGIGDAQMISEIRSAIRSLDPTLPISDPEPMTVRIHNTLYTDRLLALLSTVFGFLALALAAIGLYGVVAYMVARRTSEIGVRMALGALPRDVLRLVMSDAGLVVAIGVIAGAAAALATGRFVASQLYDIPGIDWNVLAGSAAVLAAVAALAALFPALRAAAIAPASALKYE